MFEDLEFIRLVGVDNVLVFRWGNSVATVPQVAALLHATRSHVQKLDRFSMLVRIPDDCPMQTEAARDLLQRETRAMDARMVCSATVITREGFIGSALRAAVNTMQILSRVTHPMRTFQRSDEAVRWIRGQHARHAQPAPTEAALLEALDLLNPVIRVSPSR
jgi:hypothetical protein